MSEDGADRKLEVSQVQQEAASLGMPPEGILLVVDIVSQQMSVYRANKQLSSYPVSTSQFGLGEKFESSKTPRGFHHVAAWYGEGMPVGTVFLNRKPTAEVIDAFDWKHEGDYEILTRIMRLKGLQQGLNAGKTVDSFERLIYIHGTNQEQYCGHTPMSNGCIRMRNHDIVELFDLTQNQETWCWIGNLAK